MAFHPSKMLETRVLSIIARILGINRKAERQTPRTASKISTIKRENFTFISPEKRRTKK